MRFIKQVYGDPIFNAVIAKAEGQKTHTRPFAWVAGDKKYSYITGGIALPKIDQPGYLLTVGVDFDNHNIGCLDEFESQDAYVLIQKAKAVQVEYGPVIGNWWGNPKELMSLVNEKNAEGTEDKKKGNPVYISAPVDSEQKDAFGIYMARLVVGLSPTYQTFFINQCDILRNYIASFIPSGLERSGNNPAIYIAGALLHTILLMRPWEYAVESVDLLPTTLDEIGIYGRKKEQAAMYKEIYGIRS